MRLPHANSGAFQTRVPSQYRRGHAVQHFVVVGVRRNHGGIRVEQGKRRQAALPRISDVIDQEEVVLLVVPGAPEGALEKQRRTEVVVDRPRIRAGPRIRHSAVVPPGDAALKDLIPVQVALVLVAHAQGRPRLIVETDRRLVREGVLDRPDVLKVRPDGRAAGRHRPDVEDGQSRLVETIRRDPAEHAAVGEAGRLARRVAGPVQQRIFDVGIRIAEVVGRLREVASALERRRDAESLLIVPAGARPELDGIEEKELVVAPRLPDRAADRVAPILLLRDGLRGAVEHVRPAVGVPGGIALHVVDRAAEPVRPALGHRHDLQAAVPPVFGLVARHEELDLGDRLRVHLQHHRVAARVERRDAVHRDIGRHLGPCADRLELGGGDARRQSRQRMEAPVRERQVLDRLGGNGKRPLPARRLNDRRFGLDFQGLCRGADLERERPHRDTRSGAHGDARPLQGAERGHRDFNRVGVDGDVREHEVPGRVRDGRR